MIKKTDFLQKRYNYTRHVENEQVDGKASDFDQFLFSIPSLQGANKFKDDGAIHIFTHGSSAGISPYVDLYNSGKDSKSIVHDVISFKQLLNKSQIWRNRKNGEHVTIVLHGCMTGRGENSFAEIVSSALKDVTIITPDNILYISEDGEIGVYSPQKDLPEKANNLDFFAKILVSDI